MEKLLADTLQAWREAERLLLSLSVGADHELVRDAFIQLRRVYATLAAPQEPTLAQISSARVQVASINAMMREVRARLGLEGQ